MSRSNLMMEIGAIEEQVTVVAQTPTVDTKKTTVGANVDKEAMQSLPSARDPWVILQLAPSIMVDRENVGGNESGQQSGFIGKGDTSGARISGNQGANNIWAVDGIDVTDPAALGGSAGYYDFDMFEELQIQTGGAADVTIQTGGIALNMVTRRGGNKTNLAGRFYLTDNYFQADNLTDDLKAQGVVNVNKIEHIKDFGFNVGGPIIKDKLWWWAAYGVQDIFVYTIVGAKDTVAAQQLQFQAQRPAPGQQPLRSPDLLGRQGKVRPGFEPGPARRQPPDGQVPLGQPGRQAPGRARLRQRLLPVPEILLQRRRFRLAADDGRQTSQYPIVYDNTLAKYVAYKSGMNASWGSYGVSRPGTTPRSRPPTSTTRCSGCRTKSRSARSIPTRSSKPNRTAPGNIQGFNINRDYTSLQLDANADGTRTTGEMAGWQRVSIYRRSGSNSLASQWAAYIQDTIVKGNFTLQLGLRFDKQWPGVGRLYPRRGPARHQGLGRRLRPGGFTRSSTNS